MWLQYSGSGICTSQLCCCAATASLSRKQQTNWHHAVASGGSIIDLDTATKQGSSSIPKAI